MKLVKLLFLSLFFVSVYACAEDAEISDLDDEMLIDEPTDGDDGNNDDNDDDGTDDNSDDDNNNDDNDDNEPEDPPISVANSAVNTHGQLSINGVHVVDKNNAPVQLRGMSLFWSQWEGDIFYNAETVKWLKDDWNINIIRAAMGVEDPGGYIQNPATEKAKVFAVIDAAIAEGIYVIVDWHSHHAENYKEQAKAFFTEVAQKYGDYPNIIYETYNEPMQAPSWNGVLKPYHEEIIAEIRKYDSDNLIICGTRVWSQRVDEVIGNEINDDNVAYTLHYYASYVDHQQALRDIALTAINAGLPLFVTEYGVTLNTGDGTIIPEEAEKWWAFLDEHKISWCNWSIVNKTETSAAIPNITTLSGWTESQLSQSGKMVKAEILKKNPRY